MTRSRACIALWGFHLPHRSQYTSIYQMYQGMTDFVWHCTHVVLRPLRAPIDFYACFVLSPLLGLLLRLVRLVLLVLQHGCDICVRLRRWHFPGLRARVWSGW